MEESKKVFVVGEKPTILYIIISAMVPLFFSLILGSAIIEYFKLYNFIIVCITIMFTFLLLSLLYVPTIVRCRQYWCINGLYLESYAIDDYIQQLKYLISIFNGKNDMFAFKIKLAEIESVGIYWTTMWVISATPVHFVYFGIKLKEGSIVTFRSVVTANNKEYINAVKYLKEECNIQIVDKYNLLGAMEEGSISLAEYIDKIEKQQGKWGINNDKGLFDFKR
ncbi:hypothetical protein D2A34_00465 [Clostridium chromiireducens]|uniref:Uncharacterized protein n=1 Tax=Clostridium chromiireducens TaxID=225345 RepID=A0A399ITK3_9CLOT|nr:hypothetical protein [Clostridium chromiireducens]RII35877.1 hypothetical protein D2A34_00465 [Clostridium chromiireducens]